MGKRRPRLPGQSELAMSGRAEERATLMKASTNHFDKSVRVATLRKAPMNHPELSGERVKLESAHMDCSDGSWKERVMLR